MNSSCVVDKTVDDTDSSNGIREITLSGFTWQ